jgi:hypothetical protein
MRFARSSRFIFILVLPGTSSYLCH